MSPTVSVVNLCLGPALPVLPLLVIFAWARVATLDRLTARFGPRSDRALRLGLGVIAFAELALDVLHLSAGRFTPGTSPVGVVQALYIVMSYPLWFLIAFVGFVNLMALPALLEGPRTVLEVLSLAALALWLVMVGAFLVTDPSVMVNWYAGFSRYAPLNLAVGGMFALAAIFMHRLTLKDRQITLVTLLMIGLFVGMVGMIAMSAAL